MMTGDWAAAVYYDGIDTSSNQAAWLTDEFLVKKALKNEDYRKFLLVLGIIMR